MGPNSQWICLENSDGGHETGLRVPQRVEPAIFFGMIQVGRLSENPYGELGVADPEKSDLLEFPGSMT